MEEVWDVTCPSCWEPIAIQVLPEGGNAQFVEDCSVCCRALTVSVTVSMGRVVDVSVSLAY